MFYDDSITDALVAAARGGDASARERLMQALAPFIRSMVTVRLAPTASQVDALDDLMQQVLATVGTDLATLREGTVVALRAYCSVLVARRVADYLRRGEGAEEPVVSLNQPPGMRSGGTPLWALLAASSLTPRTRMSRKEDLDRVMTALSGIEPREREAITVAFFDHLGVAGVAERMGVSRGAASMLLMRAMRRLRRAVTGSSGLGPS